MSTLQQPVDNWNTGSDQIQTTLGTVASGANVPDRTPLGQVTATGKFVVWNPTATDGSEKAVRLTSYQVNAASADVVAQLVKAGTFNPELVNWPAGATAVQKLGAFVGTPISFQLPA